MELKIIVCIKSVVVDAPGGRFKRVSENCILNPFDRPALEMALFVRETYGGSVTALSMGPTASEPALYEAMAMGADRAVLLNDRALRGSDTLATSTALSSAILKLSPFDLLLFGTKTADSDTGQVGPQTAVGLDLPLVTWVKKIEESGERLQVQRTADGFAETYNVKLPAAFTIHPEALKARDMGLHGIGAAYNNKTITRFNLEDVGLSPEQVGEDGSPTKVLSMKRAVKKRSCMFLSGNAETQAADLMEKLLRSGLLN